MKNNQFNLEIDPILTPLDAMTILASHLRSARILHGLTQADLAKSCKLSLRTIKNMENAKNVSLEAWLCVQKKLGYIPDIISTISRPKPLTLDQFEKIAREEIKDRKRVRKS